MITVLRYLTERLLTLALMKAAAVTSWERLPILAAPLARLLWLALPKRCAITVDNLRRALPLSQDEAKVMARRVFRHFVLTELEFLKMGTAPAEAIAKVRVRGLDAAKAAWKRYGKLVFVTGHMGNFELMGARLAQEFPLWVVARPQSPASWQFIKLIRERVGMGVLSKFGSVREALRILRRGGVVGILADQHAGGREGALVVPFFGRPASVFKTPAFLAARTGAPIVFGYDVRLPDGKHEVVLLEPKEVREEGVEDATIWICQQLERAILRAPDQWWWLHDRWKTARHGYRGQGDDER